MGPAGDIVILGPPSADPLFPPGMQAIRAQPIEAYANLFSWIGEAMMGTFARGGVALLSVQLEAGGTMVTIALAAGVHANDLRRVVQGASKNESEQCNPRDGATTSDGTIRTSDSGQNGGSSGNTPQ